MSMEYLSKSGATWLISKIKTALSDKVDKVDGKGLSANDYTTAEKSKLSGIAAGAEVNQNAFSSVVVGSTTVAADAKTDSLTLVAGANVTLTPDASNDTITIAAKDTTYAVATASANGLMSKSDKSKLDGVAAGAQVNVIESVKVNGTALTPSSKAVNITVPTKVSALTNDSGFQTAAQVTSAINSAVSGITGFEFQVVTTLPSTGTKGVIYLVAHVHTGSGDVYDEFIWVTDKYEKLGNTDIDLSAYAKTADFAASSVSEMAAMWSA